MAFVCLEGHGFVDFLLWEIDMAMIEVEHLQKNFVNSQGTGVEGALRSFIHPEKQTFEAVKDLTFEVLKGQILGIYRGKWCWEVDHH